MRRSELIHIVKSAVDSVVDQIDINDIYSKAIAFAIFQYDRDKVTDNDIKHKNNFFGYKNPSTGEVVEYNSAGECILVFAAVTYDPEFIDQYKKIAKANNLYRFDKTYLESKKTNMIDMTEEEKEPNFDVYKVSNPNGEQITKTANIEEAKQIKKENPGSVVTNSRNVVVDAVVKPTKSDNIFSIILKPGAPVQCNGTNLYYHLKDKAPGRVIDGEYYLYDGKDLGNNRYAICLKPEFANGPATTITGYIVIK